MIDAFVMYADGASRGNPGPASIGAVVYDPRGAKVVEVSEVIGETTNNVAEYRALIAGLEAALALGVTRLQVRLDSLLLVRQVRGEFRVKAPGLQPLHRRVQALVGRFDGFSIEHVRREKNTVADGLANAALDA
ncbi:MAG: ribonuclease HI family protein [Actinobacteria bacterium]|nr:ribonuclease HI family protein [Actinomycetota bacterium]MBU1493036.1 ribonuclease HI family protein [Actinomycetota bacterium]MBU1866705.1 ribonuclease HI family protein [Actinomycetota bacterium]